MKKILLIALCFFLITSSVFAESELETSSEGGGIGKPLLISLIVAGVVTAFFVIQITSARGNLRGEASEYVTGENTFITNRSDRFLRTTTVRNKIKKD